MWCQDEAANGADNKEREIMVMKGREQDMMP
jgi:hypothetical protein